MGLDIKLSGFISCLCLKSGIINKVILDFGNSEMGEKSLKFLVVSERYHYMIPNEIQLVFDSYLFISI